MSSSKSLALLKLSLSPPTISLLHTLHTEFNTFLSQTSQQTQQTTQSTPKEILEGIFQVVAWDLKTQISHEEFSVLFAEWSKAKGSSLTGSRLFDMTQRNQFPIDQIVLALKNTVAEIRDFHGFLAKTAELFSYEYDSFLYRTEEIGYNYEGNRVGPVDQDSISLMNEIFKTFDQKEQGHLTLDGLFFLFIALQEKENRALIKEFDEEETFCTELNDRFKNFLTRIKCFQGRVTALQAKSYFLYNNIASKSDLNSLRKSVRNTTEMALELNENILHEYGGLLPDLLQIAIKKAFPSLNLIEINKNPTDLQILYHFLLVRFYSYVHEQDYFEGLFISNKTLLSQMMLKEARKYYGDEIFRTINWSFDPMQGFLTVISTYNELVDQVLRFYFQFKGREGKENLFTGRSARTNYYDTLNLSKDTINTSIQDYSQRQSRSMFTGRSNDNQISFRDPMEKEEPSNRYQVKMKGPPSLNISNAKKPVTVMRLLTRGVSENAKKEKENNHHYYKATQSSEKKKSITPRKKEMSLTNKSRDTSKENKRELFQVSTPTKKSIEVPARNPQSIRKALDEVDMNYNKKMMPKDQKPVSKLRREKSQEIEPVNKRGNLRPKSSRREEDALSVRLDSSINKGNSQANQIQEHQQKIMSIAASKPPLKRQNSSKKVLIVDEGTYESFNPSYYEKSVQLTGPELERGEENITPEITRREEKPETTADESFANDKSNIEPTNRSSMGLDVSKMRAQNQQAWQQEKSILEQLTKRRTSHNGLDDKAKNSSFSGSQDMNKINISEIRKGSLASQQEQAIKSMRNHDIMDILAKLDTKISEGKHSGINKPNESFVSVTSQSEQKMSLHARNSVETATMNKSIMDIMKDHIEKEKAQGQTGQTLRTRSDAEEEPKKEFYLNLKEIIGETKRDKSSHSPIKKPQETKVFSMSIADHVRLAQNRQQNEKLLAKANMGSPPTDTNQTLRESETIKSSVEKNKQIQDLVGLKKSNSLTLKSRQNSSKSPAKSRNLRVAKTESFEAVMERLKKGPGNTPTKGKASKKAF